MASAHRTRLAGFTLLEVMITVAIVGILAAIALPSYFSYIERSKIIDGTTKLGDYRAQMEKFFLDNRTYDNGGGACGITPAAAVGSDAFEISCALNSATSYTATATGRPTAGMSADFKYNITQTGAKSSTGPTGWAAGTDCWAVRKDGSCQ